MTELFYKGDRSDSDTSHHVLFIGLLTGIVDSIQNYSRNQLTSYNFHSYTPESDIGKNWNNWNEACGRLRMIFRQDEFMVCYCLKHV